MSTYKTKLNAPADWESWKEEFQLMMITADIWEIVQDHEIQIQKSVESNIEFFSLTSAAAAAAVTCSQSQAANFQATVAEDSQSTVH